MIGDDIRAAAVQYVGRTVTDEQSIIIINEALDAMSDQGLAYANAEVIAEPNTWYDMPDDATNISCVTDAEGNYFFGWRAQGSRIKFYEAGTYEISARRIPPNIDSMVVPIMLHPLYKLPLITYFKAYLKLQVNDDSPDGLRLMEKFEKQIERVFTILRRTRNPVTVEVIRHA